MTSKSFEDFALARLPDGTTLVLLASTKTGTVTPPTATTLLRDADASPDLSDPTSWLPVS